MEGETSHQFNAVPWKLISQRTGVLYRSEWNGNYKMNNCLIPLPSAGALEHVEFIFEANRER